MPSAMTLRRIRSCGIGHKASLCARPLSNAAQLHTGVASTTFAELMSLTAPLRHPTVLLGLMAKIGSFEMIDFRSLGYFLAACEYKSLGAAAKAIGVPTSTLSARLRAL